MPITWVVPVNKNAVFTMVLVIMGGNTVSPKVGCEQHKLETVTAAVALEGQPAVEVA